MAAYYWDYQTAANTTSTTTSGSYTCTAYTYCTTSTTTYWIPPPPREIIVKHPEHWTDEQTARYVRLVNDETQTGWLIKMIMNGEIRIVDPNIDIRTMKEFVPLLKHRASKEDRERIDAFFAENGIE